MKYNIVLRKIPSTELFAEKTFESDKDIYSFSFYGFDIVEKWIREVTDSESFVIPENEYSVQIQEIAE